MLSLLLLLAAVPVVTARAPDARGCTWPVVDGAPARGGPRDFCVRQVLAADLEPGQRNVVLLVDAPHRFDATVRPRIFVYRLDGRRLVPRFLGSGFTSLSVERLAPSEPGVLRLAVRGQAAPLTCRFVGFPLVCEETSP